MKERRERTVEDLLKDGPPLAWYYGFGSPSRDITGVHYNEDKDSFGGELLKTFDSWIHTGTNARISGLREDQADKFTPIAEKVHELAQKVFDLSGFWPEEIEQKGLALLQIFRGQYKAPFDVFLIEPLSKR